MKLISVLIPQSLENERARVMTTGLHLTVQESRRDVKHRLASEQHLSLFL